MLYTRGFLLGGVVAAAVTLAAIAELPASAGTAQKQAPCVADRDALHRLARAVDDHTFHRDRLREPDFDMAVSAREAADLAEGRTREALLVLADSAARSALEFLVDYNIAAGGWEAATGIRMPAATMLSA
ncbi:hypothetical protein GCM10022288_22180 [Gryllotalpicola kribbensis]|jgi:hypothetical protein|uniref:Uncharacterized protein n=1 Tax=Gryllotalpicola kribbensis TaxID=993084 RepID=A0ABP8AVC5_9MICO